MIAPPSNYIGRGGKYEKLFNVADSIRRQKRSDNQVQFLTHIRVEDSMEHCAQFKKIPRI